MIDIPINFELADTILAVRWTESSLNFHKENLERVKIVIGDGKPEKNKDYKYHKQHVVQAEVELESAKQELVKRIMEFTQGIPSADLLKIMEDAVLSGKS